MSGQVRIERYVDPCCPCAWIAYQWLAEVRQHRALELGLHLMNLPMLNEHQSISPGHRRLLAHTWGPARVAAAAGEQHGQEALAALYEAVARRIFAGADHYQVIREDLESVILDAPSQVGLPAHGRRGRQRRLRRFAPSQPRRRNGTHGQRRWHAAHSSRRQRLHWSVMTAVPPGFEAAVEVFDGLQPLAGYPRLFEIKRPLAGSLELGYTEPELSRPGSTERRAMDVTVASARSA